MPATSEKPMLKRLSDDSAYRVKRRVAMLILRFTIDNKLNVMGPFSKGWTEEDVERVLRNGILEELLYVPIVVGMNAADCDREWAENICVALAEHPHFNVRGNAVLGFGHIARTCRALNTRKILPIIDKALKDHHEYVRGHAEDALSDIKIYLRDRGDDLEE